jgi:Flp pilus assembly protein TadG
MILRRPREHRRTPVRSCRTKGGWALAEGMVALSVGLTFLVALAGIFVNCSLSFAEVGNYVNMDRKSRNALDQMTRRIRSSKSLQSFDPALLVFNYDSAGTTNLAYRYDATSGLVTEEWTVSGTTTVTTLLSGCNSFAFSLFDRDLNPTTVASSGKAISIAWQCNGTVINRTNTESMQQAQVVIRNQP